jgi:DNA-directed RNA polymerase subunit L
MPVLGIENNIIKYEKNKDNDNDNDNDIDIEKDDIEYNLLEDSMDNIINDTSNPEEKIIPQKSSTLNQLTMYVNYTSKEKNNMTVTTNDVKFYYKEKNIKSPYKNPIPLIDLQPGQTINFSAITSLGTERESAIYSAVSVCYYKEINENEFDFIIESRGQLKEDKILEVALLNLIEIIKKIPELIPDNKTDKNLKGEILINGENNTIGNLLSHGLQNHKKIKFSGYCVPHLLDEKILISYELYDNEYNIKYILNEVIHYFVELFNKILKLNLKKN